ncbi:sugar diacid utilization regulator [Acetobacterium paludosum]|uniref:Sugar diacid utilization regulator n=1 Tax=Acetobacterium paludosum TaxID=52693 RepID=A0A923I1I8_9FIRM|nr:sugar diacid recognition domain-containing protein [Acetobacterium paludosum]MBC3888343.1 sugar diacid utilization regulator [Acetobacterium paludosum]
MLDKKIAQKIADEVMTSLGYNINVMNENAIIIGSGSSKRLGTFHEIAMFVIQNCLTYEVTEEESKKLQGVKPGINMPIVDKTGNIIGVVGITGDPDEVRNIGKLVKMTAELIIEQQETMNRFYSHRNDKEIFLNTLISDQMTISQKEIVDWGKRIGYNMENRRVAIILNFGSNHQTLEKGFLERILNQIKMSDKHLKDDISSVMSGGFILIFKTIKETVPWAIEQSINTYLEEIIRGYAKDLQCFIGGYYPEIKGYLKSYRDAYGLYRSNVYKKDQFVYFAHHHYFWRLYSQLDPEILTLTIKPYLQKIQSRFGKGTEDAMITMRKIFDYHFQFEKVASDLFIHKNTVIFRKKKMEECLGFSLKCSGNNNLLFMIILTHYEELNKTVDQREDRKDGSSVF